MRYSILIFAFLMVTALVGVLADAGQGSPGVAGPAVSTTSRPVPAADNEAAARHARLMACLEQAKRRKLAKAQKAAFLKECVAAP